MKNDKRLIDANALKGQAVEVEIVTPPHNHYCSELVVFGYDIDEAPTIDAVEVVHGRWSEPFIGGYDGLHAVYYMTCSKCMAEVRHDIFRFCPNCGAKMDGGA